MYRFWDRQTDALAEPLRFLLAAMRAWTGAARAGRCSCAAVARGFAWHHAQAALPDFAMLMTTLDRDHQTLLRLGAIGSPLVTEDEARLLALLDAALAGAPARVARIATTLVAGEATSRLSTAAGLLALHLTDGIFVERDC